MNNGNNVMGVVDMSSTKPKGEVINAFDMFNTPRVEGEPDLVTLMIRDLTNHYCAAASAIFIAEPAIINVQHLNPISQRIIINRWFTNTLLLYRNRVEDTAVSEILLYVINDGTVNDWLELMQRVVIPFFKKNNVLNILDGE